MIKYLHHIYIIQVYLILNVVIILSKNKHFFIKNKYNIVLKIKRMINLNNEKISIDIYQIYY